MRLAAVVVAALAALSAVRSASSNDLWPSGTVCGRTKCFSVGGQSSAALFAWQTRDPWAQLNAPPSAPFYVIRFRNAQYFWANYFHNNQYRTSVEITEELLYVPSRQIVRVYDNRNLTGPQPVGPYWRSVSIRAESAMNQVVSRIAPHPAPRAWPRPNLR